MKEVALHFFFLLYFTDSRVITIVIYLDSLGESWPTSHTWAQVLEILLSKPEILWIPLPDVFSQEWNKSGKPAGAP